MSPLQGSILRTSDNPGRCPGLSSFAPLGGRQPAWHCVPGFDESSLWDEELDLPGQQIYRLPPYFPSPHDITFVVWTLYLAWSENFFNGGLDPAMTGIDGNDAN